MLWFQKTLELDQCADTTGMTLSGKGLPKRRGGRHARTMSRPEIRQTEFLQGLAGLFNETSESPPAIDGGFYRSRIVDRWER